MTRGTRPEDRPYSMSLDPARAEVDAAAAGDPEKRAVLRVSPHGGSRGHASKISPFQSRCPPSDV